jgi:hypothetical protein
MSRSSAGSPRPASPPRAAKNLRQQSDQSLGRGRWGIEVPRAQVPLLENQEATRPEQPLVRRHLLATASERSDQEAGMDEIERVRLELAVKQIIDDKRHVGDPFCRQK